MGPAVQDLWMLLSGDRQQHTRQLGALMDGYEQFRTFDRRELALIEPLRTLRLLHYSAWLARRWDDPTFPITSRGLAPATTGKARCKCCKSRLKPCRKTRWWPDRPIYATDSPRGLPAKTPRSGTLELPPGWHGHRKCCKIERSYYLGAATMLSSPREPTSDRLGKRSSSARALQKGQQTKQIIIDAALGLAEQIGLEGLSIGALAEVTHMSKSGVFAHFGSREELQISVMREYFQRFSR